MHDLSAEYDSYFRNLQHDRAWASVMAIGFAVLTVAFAITLVVPVDLPESPVLNVISAVTSNDNALNWSTLFLELTGVSALRYWFLGREKINILLSRALIQEREHDLAVGVLLSSRRLK